MLVQLFSKCLTALNHPCDLWIPKLQSKLNIFSIYAQSYKSSDLTITLAQDPEAPIF